MITPNLNFLTIMVNKIESVKLMTKITIDSRYGLIG